jgi:hypothetical protein
MMFAAMDLPASSPMAAPPALVAAAQGAAAAELQRPLRLAVQTARTSGAWGFVLGTLQAPDGTAFDYRGTVFEEAAREGYLSRLYAVLLRRSERGAWQVVTSRVGPTDPAWAGWAARYQAPAVLFDTPR